MTVDTTVYLMVQHVSTVLILLNQDICPYSTKSKYYTKPVYPYGDLLIRPKRVAPLNTTVMM
jgi:hypothetical protein